MRSLSFLILYLLFFISGKDFVFAQSPHGRNLNIDCSSCHESSSWKVIPSKILFNHDSTGFKLSGQHKSVDCKSCHKDLIFSEVQQNCSYCHKDVHQNTVGFDCSRCHSSASWIVPNINQIHRMSRFPLVGAHLTADCFQCHAGYQNLNFNPIGISCIDCHRTDFNNTAAPNHLAAGFSTECQDCHSVNNLMWIAVKVNHDFFPLVGGHKIDNCFSCHFQSSFKGLSPDCYSCHKKDYEAAKDPDHIAAKISTDCQQCHNINSFIPAFFDHSTTGFPLTGQHKTVSCSRCHQNGYQNISTDCYSCHSQHYESTKDPNHVNGNFSKDCSQCHNTNSWGDAIIDHNQTAFPLTGAHINVSCNLCHSNGYTNTPIQCYSCHANKYTSAVNPNHTTAGISTECQTCHSTSAWSLSTFNHATTGFDLTGQHKTLDCNSCHKGTTSGLSATCVSCHQTEYNNAPNHLSQKYPATCEMCHTTTAWIPSNFNHQTTSFPLTGAHTTVQCSSCHANGFTGTPTNCISCHQKDYDNTTDPNHQQAGFSTECQACHNTSSWGDATFDHSTTGFQLLGKHATTSCVSCHISGYKNTPSDCYSCHKVNYDNTNNPNHSAAGFPTACEQCHNTSNWNDATFNHDGQYFPIYSGSHSGKWNSCSDCHTNPNNYLVFECINCHEHNKTDTDNHHREVRNYVYSSDACYSCHPDGRSGD